MPKRPKPKKPSAPKKPRPKRRTASNAEEKVQEEGDASRAEAKRARKKTSAADASTQSHDAALLIERAAPLQVKQQNPKKGKSAERYDKYKAAETARECPPARVSDRFFFL